MPLSLNSIKKGVAGAVKQVEINRLKREAREAYISYTAEVGRYDCGAHLAEHVNPRVYPNKIAFNNAMDELTKLDPTCPPTRL